MAKRGLAELADAALLTPAMSGVIPPEALTPPEDKETLRYMARKWDLVANEREAALPRRIRTFMNAT